MPRGSLDDQELTVLARLLQRYAENDLDQFEHWSVSTTHGRVYFSLGRHRNPDLADDSIIDLDTRLRD